MINLQKELFNLINKVRQDPQYIIPSLKQDLQQYQQDNVYQPQFSLQTYKTTEGQQAVKEAIEYLNGLQPTHSLQFDQQMEKSTQECLNLLQTMNIPKLDDPNGANFTNRLDKYGKWSGRISEQIFVSKQNPIEPLQLLMEIIIDDGNVLRSHRNNLLSSQFNKIGISIGENTQTNQIVVVINYATQFVPCSMVSNPNFSIQALPSYQIFEQADQFEKEEFPINPWNIVIRDIFNEINRIRTQPLSYVPYLESLLSFFQGKTLRRHGYEPLYTHEGPQGINETIQFLENQKAVTKLTWDKNLGQISSEFTKEISRQGKCSLGSIQDLKENLEKSLFNNTSFNCGVELGAYSAQDFIFQQLYSDGDTQKLHRKLLFQNDFSTVGIACANHSVKGTIFVVIYGSQSIQKQTSQFQNNLTLPTHNNEIKINKMGSQDYKSTLNYLPSYTYNQLTVDNEEVQAQHKKSDTSSNILTKSPQKFQRSCVSYIYDTEKQQIIEEPEKQQKIEEQLKKLNLLDNRPITGIHQIKALSIQDPDKPPNTVKTSTEKKVNIINGVRTVIEKKIYTLNDGTQKVVEKQYNDN